MDIGRTNVDLLGPLIRGAAVTPSDSATMQLTRQLFFGGAGNVKVTWADGTASTHAVTAGSVRNWSVRMVWATGTTATAIEAFW